MIRTLAVPAALAAGEALGFALHRLSPAWPLAAVAALLAALFGHGLAVRGWRLMVFCALGFALSLRTVETRTADLEDARLKRGPFTASLAVEGEPRIAGPATNAWVSFDSSFASVPLRVIGPLPEGVPPPETGERWICAGWLERLAPGDMRRVRLWVKGAGTSMRRDVMSGRSDARAVLADLRRDLSRRLGIGLEDAPEVADLNRAILLGERSRLPRETRRLFADAGTLHIFAISGLHVAMVAHILLTAMILAGLPYRAAGPAVVPALWLYVLMIGAPPSAARAAAMTGIYCLAPVFRRRPDALAAWAVVFTAFHLARPQLLADVGSLLSFTVMLGIVLFMEWSRDFKSRLVKAAGFAFAAWAAGVPVAAHVFGRVTPGGLLANIVLVPAAWVSVCAGALGAAASYVSGSLAAHLNNLSALLTRLMVGVSWAVSRIPGASFATRSWDFAECTAWYAVIVMSAWLARSVLLRHRRSA